MTRTSSAPSSMAFYSSVSDTMISQTQAALFTLHLVPWEKRLCWWKEGCRFVTCIHIEHKRVKQWCSCLKYTLPLCIKITILLTLHGTSVTDAWKYNATMAWARKTQHKQTLFTVFNGLFVSIFSTELCTKPAAQWKYCNTEQNKVAIYNFIVKRRHVETSLNSLWNNFSSTKCIIISSILLIKHL